MNNRIYVADKDTLDEVNGKADEIKASLQSVKEDTAKIEASIMSVSSGGIAPDNMRFFSVQPADGKVKIKFQEPKDTYIDDQLICTWKGVKIVMKEGGYPENEADGTVILDCTIAGKYAEDYFEHGGLTNDTQYFSRRFLTLIMVYITGMQLIERSRHHRPMYFMDSKLQKRTVTQQQG